MNYRKVKVNEEDFEKQRSVICSLLLVNNTLKKTVKLKLSQAEVALMKQNKPYLDFITIVSVQLSCHARVLKPLNTSNGTRRDKERKTAFLNVSSPPS
jgi:hypothetical protein